MLMFGFAGSVISPDKASNSQLYGEDYKPEEVLRKGGKYLPDMMPLLKVIVSLGKKALHGAA